MEWYHIVLSVYFLHSARCLEQSASMTMTDVLDALQKLQTTIEKQTHEIAKLKIKNERDIAVLQEEISHLKQKSNQQQGTILELKNRITILEQRQQSVPFAAPLTNDSETTFAKQNNIIRKERLLLPSTTPSANQQTVAFYAYMSKSFSFPGPRHTLRFDVIKTNVGNGYHASSGVFVAPRSGIYVFTLTFRQWHAAVHGLEFIVNNDIVGRIYMWTQADDDDTTSGTIVYHVSAGQDVYIRTHSTNPTPNGGTISSDNNGYSFFAGWTID